AIPMLACILAVDAPFSPHLIVALPAYALFAALVIDAGWRAIERLGGLRAAAVFAIPVAAVGGQVLKANYREYFDEQVKTVRVAGFHTVLGRYLDTVADRDRIFLALDPTMGNVRRYSTEEFLVPKLDYQNIGPALRLPLTPPSTGKGAVVVLN